MDVLIVSANRCRDPVPVLPVGACLAAEAAERAGHRVRLVDLMFERRPLAALRAALAERRPDVVGLSVRNIDNSEMQCPRSYVADLDSIVAAVRRESDSVLVLGGAGVGVMPEQLLRRTGADWAVTGDGEVAFPALLSAIAAGRAQEDRVPGAARLSDGELTSCPFDPVSRPGAWVFPNFGRWVNLRLYQAGLATVPLQSKRGCPFGCVYCTYPRIEGREYRLCPPEEVAEEVVRLSRHGVRDVEFVDNVFNSPRDHALAVCEAIARRKPGARLHTVDVSPALLDAELLGLMERAGFAGVGVTAESASDAVLERLGKEYGAAEVRRAGELLARSRLPRLWVFLLGGPGETESTLRETLSFAQTRSNRRDTGFLSVGVRIYPGTALEGIARREGILRVPAEQMLEPVFYVSPVIDRKRLGELVRQCLARNAHFIGPGLGSLRFLPALRRLGHCAGMAPPAWKHTRLLRAGLKALGLDR